MRSGKERTIGVHHEVRMATGVGPTGGAVDGWVGPPGHNAAALALIRMATTRRLVGLLLVATNAVAMDSYLSSKDLALKGNR